MSDFLRSRELQHTRLPVSNCVLEFAQIHVCWVSDAIQPSHPLLPSSSLANSVFLSIRVISKESALDIKWPKYWNFNFGINPSNEHPGLISFKIDWLDLLAVQGPLKSLLQNHSSRASIPQCSAFFMVQISHLCMTTRKIHSFDYVDGPLLAKWCLCFIIHCLPLS